MATEPQRSLPTILPTLERRHAGSSAEATLGEVIKYRVRKYYLHLATYSECRDQHEDLIKPSQAA